MQDDETPDGSLRVYRNSGQVFGKHLATRRFAQLYIDLLIIGDRQLFFAFLVFVS